MKRVQPLASSAYSLDGGPSNPTRYVCRVLGGAHSSLAAKVAGRVPSGQMLTGEGGASDGRAGRRTSSSMAGG